MKEARHKKLHIVEFHLYEISRADKSLETESRLVVSGDWVEGGERPQRGTVFLFKMIKMCGIT